jgi:hypothetical protein
MRATQTPDGDAEPDSPIKQLAFTYTTEGDIMYNRRLSLAATTTGGNGRIRPELNKQGFGTRM